MKRIENYKGYTVDTDNLGRVYIHNNNSRYSEDSDKIIIADDDKYYKVKEIKAIIDKRVATGQDIRSL